MASLPSWRRHLGRFAAGGCRLSLESFRFYVCLRSFRLHRPGCMGHRLTDTLPPFCSLTDASPPFSSGEWFAFVIVLVGDCGSGGCFAIVVV